MATQTTALPLSLRDLPTSFARAHDLSFGFFGRLGGVSRGALSSLNIGESIGDRADDLQENRRRVLAALGAHATTPWHQLQQVHGSEVAIVTADTPQGARPQADGWLTAQRDVALCLYTADCVPLLMAARDGSWIGAAHAGWRGTVGRVAGKLIDTAVVEFFGKPQSTDVLLGPAIGPCCFVVGPEVTEAVSAAFSPQAAAQAIHVRREGTFVDLWALNTAVLLEAGVAPSAIHVSRICTSCRNDHFFSYRHARGACGRQAAVIIRRSEQ